MAQSKAHEVDRYLAKPDAAHRVILIYGPDTGLVSERAVLLAKSSGAALDDPFATIRIDADDAASDPARLADEAHTVSMFGGQRLVWVKGSTLKNLVKAVQPLLDQPPTDALVIIEAGDLKKSAPLRTRIEKSGTAMALPCYADQAAALDRIIDEECRIATLTIDSDARSTLKSLLGSDRIASRGEVQKLCLYAANNQAITVADIEAIVGDAGSLAVDSVVDAAATGDIATMEHMFKRLLASGTSPVMMVGAIQRHFQMLHGARAGMEVNRTQAQSAVSALRPPINFQRREKVTRALAIWSVDALTRTLGRLDQLAFDARANQTLAPALTATALLAIAIEARRSGR